MTTIFEHTDGYGDRVEVEETTTTGQAVTIETPNDPIVYLTPDAVTRLRAALAPFDPATKDAPAPEPAIEVGREYRLLPGAKYGRHGTTTSAAVADGATRIRVVDSPDSDGDYYVTALDGARPGRGYYTAPQYLAPLDEPKPEIEAGREYRVLPGARASVSRGVSSIALDEVTRVLVRYGPDGDGDYYVTALDGNDPGDRYFVLAQYLAPLDEPKPEIEVGGTYRLLPDATSVAGRGRAFSTGCPTRVRVLQHMGDGDYRVEALDGPRYTPGTEQWVGARYLAPLDEVEAEPAPTIAGAEPVASILDELTDAQADALGDPAAYVVTDESFPLDARRVAALKLAAELAGPASIFGGTNANTVLDFAAFLLDELTVEDDE